MQNEHRTQVIPASSHPTCSGSCVSSMVVSTAAGRPPPTTVWVLLLAQYSLLPAIPAANAPTAWASPSLPSSNLPTISPSVWVGRRSIRWLTACTANLYPVQASMASVSAPDSRRPILTGSGGEGFHGSTTMEVKLVKVVHLGFGHCGPKSVMMAPP
jgi:hypothetical protein